VRRFYLKEHETEAGLYFEVMFDGDEVSLDIPEDGLTLHSGWSLLPLVYPMRVKKI